jgi:hypothetical protein
MDASIGIAGCLENHFFEIFKFQNNKRCVTCQGGRKGRRSSLQQMGDSAAEVGRSLGLSEDFFASGTDSEWESESEDAPPQKKRRSRRRAVFSDSEEQDKEEVHMADLSGAVLGASGDVHLMSPIWEEDLGAPATCQNSHTPVKRLLTIHPIHILLL